MKMRKSTFFFKQKQKPKQKTDENRRLYELALLSQNLLDKSHQ